MRRSSRSSLDDARSSRTQLLAIFNGLAGLLSIRDLQPAPTAHRLTAGRSRAENVCA